MVYLGYRVPVLASGLSHITKQIVRMKAYSQANPKPFFPEPDIETDVETDTHRDTETLEWVEPPYRVLIHNDNVTTFDFVIRLMQSLFKLSYEIAEHIATVTHFEGLALVCVRPRSEAEKLVGQGIFAARMEGFPLMLSSEPEE